MRAGPAPPVAGTRHADGMEGGHFIRLTTTGPPKVRHLDGNTLPDENHFGKREPDRRRRLTTLALSPEVSMQRWNRSTARSETFSVKVGMIFFR